MMERTASSTMATFLVECAMLAAVGTIYMVSLVLAVSATGLELFFGWSWSNSQNWIVNLQGYCIISLGY